MNKIKQMFCPYCKTIMEENGTGAEDKRALQVFKCGLCKIKVIIKTTAHLGRCVK